MPRRLQTAALIELVVIVGLVAALGIEAQAPSTHSNHSTSSNQSSTTTQTSTSTEDTQSGPIVNSSYYLPNGLIFQSRAHTIPIFLVNANSSGVIYVVYELNGSQPISLKTNVNTTADEPAGSVSGNQTIPEVFDQISPDVQVVPSQSSISPPGGIVSFSFTVSVNASGLYAVSLPNLFCTPMWFAVGYMPSQITSSSFPFPASECNWGAPVPFPPLENDRGYVVGTQGIEIVYASYLG